LATVAGLRDRPALVSLTGLSNIPSPDRSIPTTVSIRTEVLIDARPEDIWTALRDFGAVHQRLAPGFVTDARLDGDARVVTFFSGAVGREQLIDIDDEGRRLVYSVIESPLGLTHHNASGRSSRPAMAEAGS
jgi:polyketide cyclase/dehydrase/lipid transport protein